MGRFGNVMLTNGQTMFSADAARNEVVRLYVVNTANTRIFNFAVRGARMKLVGGDSGRYERETLVDEVLLSPSERAVIDVLFDTAGEVRLEHRTPDRIYHLGTVTVPGAISDVAGGAAASFDVLRVDPELTAVRQSLDHDLHRPPDKTLAFFARMPLLYGTGDVAAASYACPMHPDVTATEPGTCPRCGMKLLPVPAPAPTSYTCPMHPEVTATEPGTCPRCGMKLVPSEAPPAPDAHPQAGAAQGGHEHADGLEWEDLMPEINRASDPSNMIWQLIDRETGAENGGHRLGIHRRRPGENPAGQRDGIRPPDASPVPHPRRRAVPRPGSGTIGQKTTWCGRTPSWYAPDRPWTSCSTSATLGYGWRTATSPNTPRAA